MKMAGYWPRSFLRFYKTQKKTWPISKHLDRTSLVNNAYFLSVLDDHAPMKQIRINSRPNPFITSEIKELMNTRDMWHKRAMRTNDKLHWNAYRFFRQEVKREIKLAEKEHVRSKILKSNGNSNLIWKILNRCIPRKNVPMAAVAYPFILTN